MRTSTTTSYSAPMAARAAGVTYRQLDYWRRSGYLPSPLVDANGSGTRRRFTREQVWQIATYGALMATTPALGKPAESMRNTALAAIDLATDLDARRDGPRRLHPEQADSVPNQRRSRCLR